MQKKKNEILIAIKENIISNLKSYVIIIIIFTAGIFFGVMFINQTNSKEEINQYINTYIDETKTIQNGDYFLELRQDLRDNIILVFLLWFAGTTIIGLPIVFGIIIFRGFSLGITIASCVYVLGKVKGIIFIFITIFLQNIIFIPAIIFLGVSSIRLYMSIIKDRRKENIKISILRHFIISIIVLVAMILSSIIKIEISYRMLVGLIKYF